MFKQQSKTIREIAEKESCVIVGRCADYVLRDMDNVVKIYLYAPIRDCMRRVIRLYELNPEDAKSLIHSMNKTRGDYYQHNTGLNWSEAVHYDICLLYTSAVTTMMLEAVEMGLGTCWLGAIPVSYTHLDVYKRQELYRAFTLKMEEWLKVSIL